MQYIKVNKFLKKPLYLQIADSIESAFRRGDLKHGDQLPYERVMCDALFVTPKVVKNAYQVLINKGLIIRIAGKGTYIQEAQKIVHLLRSALCPEYKVESSESEILFLSTIEKPSSVKIVSKEVQLDYQITKIQKQIVAFKKIYLSTKHFPNLSQYENFIEYLKERFKGQPLNATTKLNVHQASSVEASYLNISVDDPVFLASTIIELSEEVICQIYAYYPGKHTVWRDKLAKIPL
jgi:GntR family transcriptional regulator